MKIWRESPMMVTGCFKGPQVSSWPLTWRGQLIQLLERDAVWPRRRSPIFWVAACLARSSTVKMEVVCSSETSVKFYLATRRNIPDDNAHNVHRCKDLKWNNKIWCVCFKIPEDGWLLELVITNTIHVKNELRASDPQFTWIIVP